MHIFLRKVRTLAPSRNERWGVLEPFWHFPFFIYDDIQLPTIGWALPDIFLPEFMEYSKKQLLNPVCLTSVMSLIPNCQKCQQAFPAFIFLLSSSYILYVPPDRWHPFYHTILNILEFYLWPMSYLGTCFLVNKSIDVPNFLFSAFLISLHCHPSRSENVMCMAPVLWSIYCGLPYSQICVNFHKYFCTCAWK